ncbi:hypothetical protein RND81_04G027300 [Saponaria officinalis]|uniref:Endonuclease/exonuclease/phosphatase domain-containing protein n=1 Tax=Saponaria officinalis TaxID=3572 RepID=A0AAW1LHT4_SAPOF
MKICSWNVRGCNDPLKLQDVCNFIRRENMDVFGVLETRIKEKKALKLAGSRFKAFGFLANYAYHRNGRIWVLWNPCTVSITSMCAQSQYLHCHITHYSSGSVYQVTFVYVDNDPKARLSLWPDHRALSVSAHNWLLVGDFNVVRDASERISSSLPNLSDILDFNACLLDYGLEDMSGAGLIGLLRFPPLLLFFFPRDPQYHEIVNDAWSSTCSGTPMYKFIFKLKQVRGALRDLHRNGFSNIQARITEVRACLEACQTQLQCHPTDGALFTHEHHLKAAYTKLLAVELSILRQRAKADGIIQNDSSTKFFYARVNERRQAQIIGSIIDHHGDTRTGLPEAVIGTSDWSSLVRHVLDVEIDAALASIKPDKILGPDGFSSAFFCASWDTIKHDFRACVHDFFRTGLMANKTLANRLQPFMVNLIGKEHTAFIKGRSIFDNVLLSQSLVNSYGRKFLTPRCLVKTVLRGSTRTTHCWWIQRTRFCSPGLDT